MDPILLSRNSIISGHSENPGALKSLIFLRSKDPWLRFVVEETICVKLGTGLLKKPPKITGPLYLSF